MKNQLARRAGIALAALAVTLVSACGGSSTGDTNSASSGSSAGGSTDVTIGIGGQSALVYLPVTLAQKLGYYSDQGLNVKLVNFDGGSKAIEAMVGGSVPVTGSSYDHAIQLQTQNKNASCFVNYMALPSLVLAVSPKFAGQISSISDLKGKSVGVTAPGSSTEFFLDHLLKAHGMSKSDVGIVGVGVGPTAVSQMDKGRVAAAVMVEPDVSLLKDMANGQLKVLADTRTKQGTQDALGVSSYPLTCLEATNDWINSNSQTAQKLATAMTKTLAWIKSHDAKQIAAKMPTEFAGGHPSTYVDAINNSKQGFDTNGAISQSGAQGVLSLLKEGGVVSSSIDLSKTYTNKFVQ